MTTKKRRAVFVAVLVFALAGCRSGTKATVEAQKSRGYNGPYTGARLNRLAFPIGGIGAGMFCLEGTGAISHLSVRNVLQFFNEPCTFAALSVKGEKKVARVLEGPVPGWKIFGAAGTGNGAAGTSYGLPRFKEASFLARFPFGSVALKDPDIPLDVTLTGWSPFVPGDADSSSLPVGGLEYSFVNRTAAAVEAVFSFNTKNFMAAAEGENGIRAIKNGFVLCQEGTAGKPENQGAMAIFADDDGAVVDHGWFRGDWWDALTLTWRNIQEAALPANPPQEGPSPGASLFVPLTVPPGGTKTVRVMLAWYVPVTNLRFGKDSPGAAKAGEAACCSSPYYVPWYAGKFKSVEDVADYWRLKYDLLRGKSALFRDAFYDTTLPDVVVEAVAANLTILKSPTVLRQTDGRLWCFEGCSDDTGCCHGSCTHVWNYAQAIPHLFPDLERSLRQTEFNESQDERGHQTFRSSLPIRAVAHDFHAAADGQLGGIMKVYREWRVFGNTDWLKSLWPKVRLSLDYCIRTWDPRGRGALEEPHHNTYDIEYWGPDGHCGSFYLGALQAAVEMGTALGEDVSAYRALLEKGIRFLESELYNGEYFFQKVQWEGLNAKYEPLDYSTNGAGYGEVVKVLNGEGPKYQYGTGCLSDGVLGFWMARMCGLGEIVGADKVKSHLTAVYKYNLKHDLSGFANPQRPAFAAGKEGGLLLCTWPRGGEPALPFVYSNEVWTGIEYQVASHLMLEGMVEPALEILRLCRDRYDGAVRNPFDEYECGHWYARALSSYGLLQGLTGVRYDAVDKALYIDSRVGPDFRVFLATASGFGTAGLKAGKPFLEMKAGTLDVKHVIVSGVEREL
jgi:uncharacterized protein (DUF608 family)